MRLDKPLISVLHSVEYISPPGHIPSRLRPELCPPGVGYLRRFLTSGLRSEQAILCDQRLFQHKPHGAVLASPAPARVVGRWDWKSIIHITPDAQRDRHCLDLLLFRHFNLRIRKNQPEAGLQVKERAATSMGKHDREPDRLQLRIELVCLPAHLLGFVEYLFMRWCAVSSCVATGYLALFGQHTISWVTQVEYYEIAACASG